VWGNFRIGIEMGPEIGPKIGNDAFRPEVGHHEFATAMKSEYQPIVLTLAEEGGKPAAVALEVRLIVSKASLTPIITFFRFYRMA
jgi:hypothetical protein